MVKVTQNFLQCSCTVNFGHLLARRWWIIVHVHVYRINYYYTSSLEEQGRVQVHSPCAPSRPGNGEEASRPLASSPAQSTLFFNSSNRPEIKTHGSHAPSIQDLQSELADLCKCHWFLVLSRQSRSPTTDLCTKHRKVHILDQTYLILHEKPHCQV